MPTPSSEDRPQGPNSADPGIHPTPTGKVRKAAQFHNKGLVGVPRRVRKTWKILLAIVVILGGFAWAYQAGKLPWMKADAGAVDPKDEAPEVKLVKDKPNSLLVPEDVRKALGMIKGGVEQIAIARPPTGKLPVVMPGSTAIDPAHLIRVRVRFAPVEVVEIGMIADPHASPGDVPPPRRNLQAGDPVKKGDLLAVLKSVDLGNKKNDLFDALSQLRLDEEVLKRVEAHPAAVPEVFLLNAQRNVQADSNAVNRAENTLKTWAVPEEEIQAVRDEVKNYATDKDRRDNEKDRLAQWARVELRAPDDGFIIEQNVSLHETVVDNTTNLIQIAKVDPLIVLASLPEDGLRALQDLKEQTKNHIPWTVNTVSSKPINGFIDDISYLIDLNQHTAVVRGHIPNPDGSLRAGQYATATVEVLPPKNVVEVPIGAVVEDGKDSIVFVQTDPNEPIYTLRRVEVTNRFDRTAFISSAPATKGKQHGSAETGSSSVEPLREGERVLAAGALELKTALENKQSENVKPE
jgi:cobalt-zinc-cadmium efflux system membrane fusion protein